MKADGGTLLALAGYFALMSLFAIGGANSAVPEIHRLVVDTHHWLTSQQFADSFALAQLSPGPNIIIVSLIGYHIAGVAGAIVTTVAMCTPTSVLAFFVGRAAQRFRGSRWYEVLSRSLVPVTVGLLAASALVVATTAATRWPVALITLATAGFAFFVRVHPLWAFAAAALLGALGLA